MRTVLRCTAIKRQLSDDISACAVGIPDNDPLIFEVKQCVIALCRQPHIGQARTQFVVFIGDLGTIADQPASRQKGSPHGAQKNRKLDDIESTNAATKWQIYACGVFRALCKCRSRRNQCGKGNCCFEDDPFKRAEAERKRTFQVSACAECGFAPQAPR